MHVPQCAPIVVAVAFLMLWGRIAGAAPVDEAARGDWPVYHVTALPEEGVACPYDANGCIFWKGTYHLMYIYQDRTRPNEGHAWGHLTSTDLVNWTFHAPALVPEKGDADTGTFSGNAFLNKDGVPMLCWFGIDAGVCVATAQDDGLMHWKKHPKNPIIPIPKKGEPGDGVYKVWDPYLWLEGDTYYCLLGGNTLPNKKDTLYLCKSPDLVNWTPLGPFYEHPDLSWTVEGEDCSCPDFFKLGNKRGLMCISHKVGARLYIGRYENERFFPEQHVRMNWAGGMFFAPESLEDNKGRRIFWAWVTDPRCRPAQDKTGSGFQSLPRVLSLADDGTVRIAPVEELKALRGDLQQYKNIGLEPGVDKVLEFKGACMELGCEISCAKAAQVGLKVRATPDASEETTIVYDVAAKKLKIDMAKSTKRDDVVYGQPPFTAYGLSKAKDCKNPSFTSVEAPLELPKGQQYIQLRVFLDGPMLEVFAQDRLCMTQVVFPAGKDATLVKAFAVGGTETLNWINAWDMKPAKFENRKDER